MKLPEIIPDNKTGNEKFNSENKELNFELKDFWCWNQSNLIENRTRGILSEFIVKKALEIKSDIRIEWDSYDLLSNTGKKIEIKSAAYIQSWKQKVYSKISFGIAPTNKTAHKSNGALKRRCDFYIFCLLSTKNQDVIDPLKLNQWIFYVIETKILDKEIPTQKTITLNSLLKLKPVKCEYSELKKIIDG